MRKFAVIAKYLAVAGLGIAASAVSADAIITNGSGLYLGVNDEGHLNVTDGNVATNSGSTGLSWTWSDGAIRDATSPGCYCEGYGFGADVGGVQSGYANEAAGINNIVADGAVVSDGTSATTSAHLGTLAGLVITHAYAPSVSPNAYEVTVTITNNTGSTANDVRYMRAMDWDIPQTEFSEYVTLFGWPAANLLATTNDGFDEGNPFGSLGTIGDCPANANFTDCGIYDHGAAFIFGFGSLLDGESLTFRIFYGAGDNEAEAYAALAAVGAEVGSLGYSNNGAGAPNDDSPVYFFGFAGVGGTPIGVPEPTGIALLGLGLLGFAAARRRK